MQVQWTPDLAVGVKEIDNQHKELFKRVNSLLEAVSTGKGKDEITRVVTFLGEYAVTHFQTEENFMTHYGYINYGAHKSEHLIFARDFARIKGDLENGVTSMSVILVQKKILAWLTNHIGKTDKALGTFWISVQKKKAA